MADKKLKIAFLSAECAPFSKVGGLADVVGSLPPALQKLGVLPVLFLITHSGVDLKKIKAKKVDDCVVDFAGKVEVINIYKTKLSNSNVLVYFLSNKHFDKEEVYGGGLKKFLLYSLAAPEVMETIKFKPDIIHLHDHQVAMVPNILKSVYDNVWFDDTKTIFTIHNLNYQGKQNPTILKNIDSNIDKLANVVDDIKDGDINFMAQGILSADAITTVSPTYAKEILTKEHGANLEKVLKKRKRKLSGILNGLDIKQFDPANDNLITQKYSVKTLDKKNKNKLALQKKAKLPQNEKIPLVGFVSRLVYQKGIELISEDLVKNLDCQFVILGTGEKRYEDYLKKLSEKYPKKISPQIKFDLKTAQQIYAGSDIFLVPSRYEPCGLTQMIAMCYGSVPIVRTTGGLKDTVNKKIGFTFKKFDSKELKKVLDKAIDIYNKKPRQWRRLQINGMKQDFSWDKSAEKYIELYRKYSTLTF